MKFNQWKTLSISVLGSTGTILSCTACTEDGPLELVATESQALVGDSIPSLSSAQQLAFAEGLDAFEEVEGLADGLGPIFNEKSCANCHSVGATGGSGTQFEVRAGRLLGGVFDSLPALGGQLFGLFSVANLTGNERHAIPNCTLSKNGEPIPSSANVTARRRTTALFGLGFVDATPDATFTALAASQASSIRGHANSVFDIASGTFRVGKFGWKAQVPTLHQFSGDAYLNEMGITNPEFPTEQPPLGNPSSVPNCDLVPGLEDDGEDVQRFTDFMEMLAPVGPLAVNTHSRAGDVLFTSVGCDGCHVRTLTAGASAFAAINHQSYHPYSDFLLHDMGSLGDQIGANGTATPSEMRTAPLWGLRLLDAKHQLLHDGRATSLSDAILRHDGQALASRNAFNALTTAQRNDLLAFLNTL